MHMVNSKLRQFCKDTKRYRAGIIVHDVLHDILRVHLSRE